jgi:DNA-binding Xre family transcriptional regulator
MEKRFKTDVNDQLLSGGFGMPNPYKNVTSVLVLHKYHPIAQLELSERTGIPKTTISRWSGNRVDRIGLEILEKFCRTFECGVEEIPVFRQGQD